MNYIERLRQEAAAARRSGAVKFTSEADRICSLPVVPNRVVDLTSELKTSVGTYSLRPIQSSALASIREVKGGFFPIGVGHGKSLICLLAGTVLEAEVSIIFVPASTVGTMRQTYRDFQAHFRMPKNVHIISYAMLSAPKGTTLLRRLTEGVKDHRKVVVVADEVHRIKNKDSVRTRRILRHFEDKPETRFVGASGTITSKSIKDFAHIADLALRSGSPAPRKHADLATWSAILDVDGRAHSRSRDANADRELGPLRDWAKKYDICRGELETQQEFYRRAYSARLRTAPGVVATKASSLGTSLYLSPKWTTDDCTDEIRIALRTAEEMGEDPNGDVFPDDLAASRAYRQLSWGYFLRWDWPNGPDTDWLIARAAWRRAIRQELRYRATEGYDSPMLVTAKVKREIAKGQGALREIHNLWADWDTQRHKPPPPVETVWFDDTLVRRVLHEAVGSPHPVALWYDSRPLGEYFQGQGLPTYGAGAKIPPEAHTAALSIRAHGIGKNLVQWFDAWVLTWTPGGQATEQLLGRHHRPGQPADEVYFRPFLHTGVFETALESSMVDAQYVQRMTENEQKILLATKTV